MLKWGEMRGLRWARGKGTKPDAVRQEALVQQIRGQFGVGVPIRHRDQLDLLIPLLDGDDGLSVAVRIVREIADEVRAEVLSQVVELGRSTNGQSYRSLWRLAGSQLRPQLFALPCGFHPYIHLAAALTVIDVHARRCVRLLDPAPLQARMLEILDLIAAGWEFGRVRVDTDAADLAGRLISAAQKIRAAMPDPSPLPPAIRELMRRNNTTDVYDPTGSTVIGGINLGARMRQAFLT
jgi:hypothetical protein